MMRKSEFDKFADEYRAQLATNIRLSGETPEYFAEYKVRDVWQYVSSGSHRVSRILDFGAGVGSSVPWFKRYFPAAVLTCLDVSERSLDIASARFPGAANFQLFDGQRIPLPDGGIDLAFAACVFHHIEPEFRIALFRELRRVLAADGLLAVFEHNPLNPLTRAAVDSCPFDENASLIMPWQLRSALRVAGFAETTVRFRIFVPGVLRSLRWLERFLYWCPAGAQYALLARPSHR